MRPRRQHPAARATSVRLSSVELEEASAAPRRPSDATVHGGVLEPARTDDRLEGSLAMATWGGFLGVDMVRVHDVRATVHAVGVIA